MTFTGWSPAALDLLARLEGDPSPSLRESVRSEREQWVRAPMVELLQDLSDRDPTYADHSVSHYGSTAWWWQNQVARISLAPNVEIGIGLDADRLHLQGAWWYAPADQRERYRRAVAGRAGARLQRIVDALAARSYAIEGDVMARVPRGFPPDHRRAPLLKHRSLLAVSERPVDDWLCTPAALDHLHTTVEELRPLLEWLCDHVSTHG